MSEAPPPRPPPAPDPTQRELEALRREVAALRAELSTAQEAAKSTAETKSAFLANMSHELRTPMNAIVGYAELLREDAEDLGARGLLPDIEKITRSAGQLLALIDDILDLARIEAGRAAVYPEPVDLIELVEEIAAALAPFAADRGNALELDRSPEATFLISDRRKVAQCLTNLLRNACKFTERGRVTLAVERDTHGAVFEVRDTGIGIAPAHLEAIFQEFHQVDGSSTRRHGGTGLGLTITRKLAQLLGGTLSVRSAPGQGSTFTLRVPDLALSATMDPPTRIAAPSRPGAAAAALSGSSEPAAAPSPDTVLLVDDDPHLRGSLRGWLEEEGYRVVEARNAAEGVRFAELHRPAVICLSALAAEAQAPSSADGWSTLRVLKEREVTRDIPVVLVALADDRSRGFVLGAADFLHKPLRKDTLLATLSRLAASRSGKDVLIVDDDPLMREMMSRMLASEGYQVSLAENGRVGLERMRERPPSLVLLDLMMPEMDGFQVVAQVRADPMLAELPIVVVTAMDIPPSLRGMLARQVQAVVGKGGHDRQHLLEEVRRAVARRPG